MKSTLLFMYSKNMVRLLTVNIKNCSQSGRENVSSSSNASPLASYKEVPPTTPGESYPVYRERNLGYPPMTLQAS